ncbi:MAG: sulfite exporter TauE/SafE family protein [Anaerosomatales bacterium]|nr:sulfite exporter TauE/SafE family protein [Anaerosomatales bacterium]
MDLFLPWLGVGIVTSVHCVSMCGMLVLSYAVKGAQGGTVAQRLTPHLAYQSAKIFSYMAVGLALGAIGSAFNIDGVRGWIMVAAGAFMVLMGINMTGRVPWLKHLTFKPPAFLMRALASTRRKANEQAAEGRASIATPLTFGLLTGLMPCGPLQAAQLAAAGAGSPIQGATVMLGFGLGTAPLMLAFGTVSGMLTAKFKSRMMVVAAVIIVVLGLVMLDRGAMMLGSPVTAQSIKQAVLGAPAADDAGDFARGADGIAEVSLTIANVRYVPNVVAIPADEPVRLIVDRQENNVCSDELWIPQLGVAQKLEPFGTTVVEIPPTAAGSYTLTCQMGMMSGTLQVGSAGPTGGSRALPLLGALLIIVLLVALWRTQPKKASCPTGAPSGTKNKTGKKQPEPEPTLLGFSPQEVLIIAAFIAAAIIAGLTLGGQLGS